MKNHFDSLQEYCAKNNVRVTFQGGASGGIITETNGVRAGLSTAGLLKRIGLEQQAANDAAAARVTEAADLSAPGYETLADVLRRAFDQASSGKGKERHANNLPFHLQPMQVIAKRRGVGFLLGQADKKSEEATSLPPGRDVAEILGAINYLAGAVIFIESQRHAANDATVGG